MDFAVAKRHFRIMKRACQAFSLSAESILKG